MKQIPEQVLDAFDIHGEIEALEGGQSESFRVGEIVLKPAVVGEDWVAEAINSIVEKKFCISRPVPTKDGKWIWGGWCAWKFMPGYHDTSRVEEIIVAGREFHAELKGIPRPGFLDIKRDAWAIADRMAWGEIPIKCSSRLMKLLNPLIGLIKPLKLPSQLIHGDLIGNVLFEEGIQPGIIDFSPFWRPPDYASAIVVADAIDWYGADESILRFVVDIPDINQLLVRAEIFRVAVYEGFHLGDEDIEKQIEGHVKTVELLQKRLGA